MYVTPRWPLKQVPLLNFLGFEHDCSILNDFSSLPRYLMFDLAMNCNSDDLDDTKHMATEYMTLNMDNIKDAFQLFTEFEKQDIANKDDVSKLHDILSNKLLIEKVKIYEGISFFSFFFFTFVYRYVFQTLVFT